ncbi:MAG: hypothetical protein V4612_04645 [Pseudomonadota bacterium]
MRSSNILLKEILNRFGPGLYHIQQRDFANKVRNLITPPEVYYSILRSDISGGEMDMFYALPSTLEGKESRSTVLDLKNPEVLQVSSPDIGLPDDKIGSIIIAAGEKTEVHYGDYGVMPSSTKTPMELLKKTITIPKGSFGVLKLGELIPFTINSTNPDRVVAIRTMELSKVCNHEENIQRYSISTICKLTPKQAKQLSLAIQTQIFHDPHSQNFYEEVTSVIQKPTTQIRSSGTLMNFAAEDPDKTTDMHYHPGDRILIIVTTNKKAGATLNFCGVAEVPEQRQDSEVKIDFPENSVLLLSFPNKTHHKFHGMEFDCLSIHPLEGMGFIQAIQSNAKLDKGFLETATEFSKRLLIVDKNNGEWLSPDKNKESSKNRSTDYLSH